MMHKVNLSMEWWNIIDLQKTKKFLKSILKPSKKRWIIMITLRNVTLEEDYMSEENSNELFGSVKILS